MNIEILLGKTTEHLVPLEGTKFFIHHLMLHDFLKLKRDAEAAGFELQIASAFRDHARQLGIWNAKVKGERAVLNDLGEKLDPTQLSPTELMHAILRWSALPGTSRHHWGSDIDIFDAKTQKLEDVKLIPAECQGTGPASVLHEWLDSAMAQDCTYGFYRPYKTDRGGVAPERWHISYWLISRRIVDIFTYSIFKKNLEDSELLLKNELLEHSHEIYQRYFLNTDLP